MELTVTATNTTAPLTIGEIDELNSIMLYSTYLRYDTFGFFCRELGAQEIRKNNPVVVSEKIKKL